MNNIYKVIWSKAKNCYVVASEIARSHTKSASGSEKIGGGTRRKLLASLMALSLLCGGLGVAEASVHVNENTGGAYEVLTKQEVTDELNKKVSTEVADLKYAKASDVTTNTHNISTLDGKVTAHETAINELKTADTALDAKIEAEKQERSVSDQALDAKIEAEKQERSASDQALNARITTAINGLKAKDTELEGKIQDNADAIAATDKRTGGISRNNAGSETTIEGNVTVDNLGNVKAKGNVTADGKLKGEGVDAGAGDITTTGAVNAGSLSVENASTLKGDVTMDKKLSVTGDTSLGKTDVGGALNVTGASDLKGDVILGTNTANTVTVNGTADFNEAVNMDNGLTVTNGATKLKETTVEGKLTAGDAELKNTKVDGTLGVTGATTLDGTLTAKGEATFKENVTAEKDLTVGGKLNVGEISMKNDELDPNGDQHHSATTITADGISNNAKVTDKNGVTTESKFTHDKEGSTTYARKGDATDWKESTSNVTADGVENVAKDSKGNNNTFTQTSTDTKNILKDKDGNTSTTRQDSKGIYGYAKDKDGNKSYTKQEGNRIAESVIGQDGKQTKSEMTSTDITNTAKDGTITNDAKDIVNNATGDMTNTVGGKLNTTVTGQATENFNGGLDTTVTGTEKHTVNGKQINTVTEGQENIISGGQINNITGGQTTTVTGDKKTTVTGKTTEEYNDGLETTVTGDEKHNVTGNQTNTIGGDQTTNVTGDISNKAENITNEAKTRLTDKVGENTRVLDSEGITDTVGGSTFKQRIDAIMMESKNVSIKAEETLTNEAKVITNKASEVINNEAININNTATGIITSKASEIKNQADKLISNKVGENTWENMEDGKITTSIKDGAKQNLTQSDAAGTTQSTVDGAKSTVTIQNADGLAGAVTDGTNTSVQNQTASAIATDVKDGAGNENASVANATTSANTITNGTKANTVISTADGTSFINSEAAAPVGDGTEVKTTIKGNTITTGKVTMDYAEVMKDLGVGGNAKIDGKTTTGSLEVTGTSTLKGDVTMESNATVKKDLTVGGNATIAGDVTARSYKVDGKTYINADGINANNQKITNVADGSISVGSKDAVNGGQLYGVKRDLEHQVDKVGANAAAMANLRPMEFDPSSKWNIAAAIGNYGSETAAAIGAFYRPNDNVMVNLSTAFGTGENMVGGGVSVRLGKGSNKLSREESNALKDQVNDLTARMDALLSVLNPNMSKDFPDVPENHWAYEAVSRLAGNDIVQGYPDGEFHGDRTMTRYEMAEIIYNALSRGAEAERELVEEFKPELQAMAASEKATAERAEG